LWSLEVLISRLDDNGLCRWSVWNEVVNAISDIQWEVEEVLEVLSVDHVRYKSTHTPLLTIFLALTRLRLKLSHLSTSSWV
jgi:hypothetical protein